MSGIGSGSRVSLRYIGETTQGTTPSIVAGDMTKVRVTERNINHVKNILRSNEVRSDRMQTDVRHGFQSVEGSLPFELSRAAFDDWLLWAMSDSAWSAVTTAGSPDLSATAATSKFTRSAGSFITDGYRAGMIIATTGFSDSANNGTFRVTAVSATEITVDGTLVDEASAASRTLTMTGNIIDTGTTLKTMSLERAFEDISQFQLFKGVAINGLDLNFTPESMITGTFNLIGMEAAALSGTASDSAPTEAAQNSPFSSFDGRMYEGGSQVAIVTGITFTLNNNRELAPVVFSNKSPCVFEGSVSLTGTLSVLFQDETIYNKWVNETETSIWIKCNDDNGTDFMNFVIPRAKYTGGNINPPQNGGVVVEMPFEGLRDSTTETMISLQRSNT